MATRDREQLKAWIDEDRDMLVAFLRAFVRCKGPNPPGDTRSTADFITGATYYLDGGLALWGDLFPIP